MIQKNYFKKTENTIFKYSILFLFKNCILAVERNFGFTKKLFRSRNRVKNKKRSSPDLVLFPTKFEGKTKTHDFEFYQGFDPEVESRTQGSRPRPRTQKKIRGQGQPFRGQTLSRPRTGMLEAKAKDQGHKRKCSPKKKKVFTKIFQAISKKKKKKVFTKIFQAISTKNVFQKFFKRSTKF